MTSSKKVLPTPIIYAAAGAIAGLWLLIKPGNALNSVIKIAGWALIIDGILKAVLMLLNGKRKIEDYIAPAVEVLLGAAFMAVARFLVKLIPIGVGLILIGLGAYKIKTGLEMRAKFVNDKKWILIVALSAASIIFGIYVLLHPSGFTSTVLRILGAYLLIECAEDLYTFYVSKK